MERDWHKLLFTFDGRIGRQEWWIVYCINFVIGLTVGFTVFGLLISGLSLNSYGPMTIVWGVIMGIILFMLFCFAIWTSLATSVKRYHDRHKSGWWVLVGLIPYIGPIWQIIELGCLEGTIGANDYGADPIVRQPMVVLSPALSEGKGATQDTNVATTAVSSESTENTSNNI